LQLGLYPINDPQAVREPRPDTSYIVSGVGGDGGSRQIYWGWNPVGFSNPFGLDENTLVGYTQLNSVIVTTS